jgi:hypothetical protein
MTNIKATAESRMVSGSCRKGLWKRHFLTHMQRMQRATYAEHLIFMLNLMLTSYRYIKQNNCNSERTWTYEISRHDSKTGELLFLIWGTTQTYIILHTPVTYFITRSIQGKEQIPPNRRFLWFILLFSDIYNKSVHLYLAASQGKKTSSPLGAPIIKE